MCVIFWLFTLLRTISPSSLYKPIVPLLITSCTILLIILCNSKFLQLNMQYFYPPIPEETLDKAISFASNYTTSSVKKMRIIEHSRKLLLFNLEQKEGKKTVTALMWRWASKAELCKLIWIFTKSILQDIINKEALGLNRDEGLTVFSKVNTLVKNRLKV